MKLLPILRLLLVLLLCSVPLLLVEQTLADDSEQKLKRPKIGLVLGGGGARGAAHIGVLKVLERERIPIDFITGTSMGAIVGGAYASGLSPQEIEEILISIDWKDLLSDSARREDLSFQRKMDERRFTGFEAGFKNGRLKLPRGALAGRKLEFVLKSALRHTSDLQHFDDLPIPFRAVATDIETGKAITLKNGDLALAIRASMSIPGAFAPVELNGRLVDGYVAKNVPIDVVKEMGADIIIAVDVGSPLKSAEELETFLDVVNQVGGIATIVNVKEQITLLSDKDILIRPDLGNFTTTDFEKIARIIPLGKQAAENQVKEIQQLSAPVEVYEVFSKHHAKKPTVPQIVDFVRIAPTTRVSEERIRAKISIKTGKPLNTKQLNRDLDRIYSLGEFERVGVDFIREGEKHGLLFEPVEKYWGPNYLRFGLNFVNDFEGDSSYAVILNHRRTALNRLGAEWNNSFQLGKSSLASTEFYQPLDYADRFFIAPLGGFEQDIVDIYENGNRIAEYKTQKSGGGADFGFNWGTIAQARTGLWWGYVDAEPNTGNADLPDFNVRRAQFRTRLTYDQVDDANFPKHGLYADLNAYLERESLGADMDYEKYRADVLYPLTFGSNTISTQGSVGVNFDDDLPFYDEFTLGGPSSLSGYRQDELRGRQFLTLRMVCYHQMSKELIAFLRASYLGFSVEGGNTWDQQDDISLGDLVVAGSLFFAADTIMGPFYIAVGMNEDQERARVYFSLGQRL